MMKKNIAPQRIDPKLALDMRNAAKVRILKGLANPYPKEISMLEMTRLLRNTKGYQMSLEELKTKPKKK